jgi:methyl-accepting chemotaxis protein
MDKVTQQNAANAEESAAAAEQLSAQSEVLHGYVADLAGLVGGGAQTGQSGRVPSPGRRQERKPYGRPALPAPARKGAPRRPLQAVRGKKAGPENVIPLDDDFKDF